MVNSGNLYLIPNTLGETEINKVLPSFNTDIINYIDIFLVEDIRNARRFLKKCNIIKAIDELTFFLIDKNKDNEENYFNIINIIKTGQNVGVISEAGCPAIADPGANIVLLAHEYNINVIPLVGPSSILLALISSGFNGQNFQFHGYLPIDKNKRILELRKIEGISLKNNQTQIFMETPYRNNQFLSDIISSLNENTLLCVACDITCSTQFIKTQSIARWKKTKIDLNKRPTIFLISQ